MTDSNETHGLRTARRGQSRQPHLLFLCALGLVVAVLAFPPPAGPQSPGDSGPTGPGESPRSTPDSGGAGDGSGGSGEDGGDGQPPIDIDIGDLEPRLLEGCVVALGREPVPGRRVSVLVVLDGEPLPDRRVYFNDRLVGRTNDRGRVRGRVPYTKRLQVRVPNVGEPCQFVVLGLGLTGSVRTATPDARAAVAGFAALSPGAVRTGATSETNEASTTGARAPRESSAVTVAEAATTPSSGNASGTVPVRGTVTLVVQGEPYPGETVTVGAQVEGVPMRNATVAVDGERVGRTDADGQYRLQVPDDGSKTVTVRVERGAFAGSTTVEILVLEVSIRPEGFLPLPGGPATVTTSFAGKRPADAVIRLDGTRLGRTGPDGRLRITLPGDPGATLSARARGQTATTNFWLVYAQTVLVVGVVLVLVGLSVGLALRWYGRRPAATVAGGWLALGVLVGGWVAGGRKGLAVAVALVAVATAALVYRYRRENVAAATAEAGGLVERLLQWIRRQALRVADLLAGLAGFVGARLARLWRWLQSLPTSVSALLGRLGAWLAALPRRIARFVVGTATSLGRSLRGFLARHGPLRLAGGTVLLAVGVVGGYVLRDESGAAAGFVLACAVLAVLALRGRTTEEGETGEETATRAPAPEPTDAAETTDAESGPQTLRELWRAFARRVVPDGWKTRTPGEIARAAVDSGLPREPVMRLTEVFREVEYGERSLSEERWSRARSAYDALRGTSNEEDEP